MESCRLKLLGALVTQQQQLAYTLIQASPLHSCHVALVLTWSLLDDSNCSLSNGCSSA